MEYIIAFVLAGVGRRIAGGVLNEWSRPHGPRVFGDTPARLIFGATLAMAACLGRVPLWGFPIIVAAGWLGTTIGNFGGIGMGRSGNPYWRDFIGMIIHGLLGGFFLATGLVAVDQINQVLPSWLDSNDLAPLPLLVALPMIAGLLCPVLYEIGWCITGKPLHPSWPRGFQMGTCFGEFLWGGVLGVALCCA